MRPVVYVFAPCPAFRVIRGLWSNPEVVSAGQEFGTGAAGRMFSCGKSGTVEYLQLAHNVCDPVKGRATSKVLFTLGRANELDSGNQRFSIGLWWSRGAPATATGAIAYPVGIS